MQDNSKKIILDLCGGTGSWSKFYRENGYTVYVITLPDFDVLNAQIGIGEFIYFPHSSNYKQSLSISIKDIYGILAAPPCTEFSIAKGSLPRDFRTGIKVVNACLNIIQKIIILKYENKFPKLEFWAMENPRGFLRQFIGIPKLTFQYWEYGDNRKKWTDLWGYFNEPKKTHKTPHLFVIEDMKKQFNVENKVLSYKEITEWRAMTPPGFAYQFYKANK